MLQNLVNMRGSISTFAKLNPDGAAELNSMLDMIEKDAKNLAADKDFQARLMPQSDNEEGVEVEEPKISSEMIYEKALLAVTGEVFKSQYQEFVTLIDDNRELIATTFEDMFPPGTLTDEVVSGLNSVVPGFKNTIRIAERILEKELRS